MNMFVALFAVKDGFFLLWQVHR